ncbi:right-handed parallel beta-helix repeat-containing protein, partial [Halorhodospira sp. 9621]|uniref:right-handed parallel beta-helix repeat-containing protein n=1 Tax=Halorhodospira sp. 9621 TaxID=2899135 RepID=UPI001EE7BC83
MHMTVTEREGWGGIVSALQRAGDGDVVRLEAGTYRGDTTLVVPRGVELIGNSGTVLEMHEVMPVIQVHASGGQQVRNLEVRLDQAAGTAAGCGEFYYGIVDVENAKHVIFADLLLCGGGHSLMGFSLRASDRIQIESCHVTLLTRSGLLLAGVRDADVDQCEIDHCGGGIVSRRWSKLSASLRLTANRCHDNALSGIALKSA